MDTELDLENQNELSLTSEAVTEAFKSRGSSSQRNAKKRMKNRARKDEYRRKKQNRSLKAY